MTYRTWLQRLALGSSLLLAQPLFGCGRVASTESGNTNWLHACTEDAECGIGTCLCGWCTTSCGGAALCAEQEDPVCVVARELRDGPTAELAWSVTEDDAFVNDVLISRDGSVLYVAGGHGGAPAGLGAVVHPEFWLEAYGEEGGSIWQRRIAGGEEESNALSVAQAADGSLVALVERYVDGPRALLRRLSPEGELLEDWILGPTLNRIRASPDGSLIVAGQELIEWREGRPFTRALLGRLTEDEQLILLFGHIGLDGSVSAGVDLSLSSAGTVAIAGYSGIDPTSNASSPWLALVDGEGTQQWGHRLPGNGGHCRTEGVSVSEQGHVLAVGHCGGNWLRAYALDGSLSWERRLPHGPRAVVALPMGYAVGLQVPAPAREDGDGPPEAPDAVLLRFNDEHNLLWRVDMSGCAGFEHLVRAPDGLVAAANCTEGVRLMRYVDAR